MLGWRILSLRQNWPRWAFKGFRHTHMSSRASSTPPSCSNGCDCACWTRSSRPLALVMLSFLRTFFSDTMTLGSDTAAKDGGSARYDREVPDTGPPKPKPPPPVDEPKPRGPRFMTSEIPGLETEFLWRCGCGLRKHGDCQTRQ